MPGARFILIAFLIGAGVGCAEANTPQGKAMVEAGFPATEAFARDRAERQFNAALSVQNKPVGSRAGRKLPGHAALPFGTTWADAIQLVGGSATIQKGCQVASIKGDCLIQRSTANGTTTEATYLFVGGHVATAMVHRLGASGLTSG